MTRALRAEGPGPCDFVWCIGITSSDRGRHVGQRAPTVIAYPTPAQTKFSRRGTGRGTVTSSNGSDVSSATSTSSVARNPCRQLPSRAGDDGQQSGRGPSGPPPGPSRCRPTGVGGGRAHPGCTHASRSRHRQRRRSRGTRSQRWPPGQRTGPSHPGGRAARPDPKVEGRADLRTHRRRRPRHHRDRCRRYDQQHRTARLRTGDGVSTDRHALLLARRRVSLFPDV